MVKPYDVLPDGRPVSGRHSPLIRWVPSSRQDREQASADHSTPGPTVGVDHRPRHASFASCGGKPRPPRMDHSADSTSNTRVGTHGRDGRLDQDI